MYSIGIISKISVIENLSTLIFLQECQIFALVGSRFYTRQRSDSEARCHFPEEIKDF